MTILVFAVPSRYSGQERVVAGESIETFSALPKAPDKIINKPVQKTEVSVPELSARAVLVQDIQSGTVMYESGAGERFPIASLTKLVTAILVADNLPAERVVEITAADTSVPQPRTGFVPGERVAAGDLLEAMLISSANDATLALARTVSAEQQRDFILLMNEKADFLGMNDTSFANPLGLDDPEHFSTARDLAKLVKEFLSYPDLLKIVKLKEDQIASVSGGSSHTLLTTNKLLLKYDEVLGLKTGYTGEAKGNLIILLDKYFSILLGSDNREVESEAILNWVEEGFVWTPLETSEITGLK